MGVSSNPYAAPSEAADGSSTRRRDFDIGVDIEAFAVELRGRLAAADLAVTYRVTEELQVGTALRHVLASLLLVLLVVSVGGLTVVGPPLELGPVAVCVALLIALADLLGLRHVRYRIMGELLEGGARAHLARFDRHGLFLAPIDQLEASRTFGWPSVDLLTMREGILITPRRGTRVICFVPVRDLTDDQRQRVEALAAALGGRVLARPRGEPPA